jgi:Pectate lyase superfamily protein
VRTPIDTGDFENAAEWLNVKSLGAMGDGVSDDTVAIQRALDTARAVYLPLGRYLVSDTLRMRPDSVLVGLHCRDTSIVLRAGVKGFESPERPRALLDVPAGGAATLQGIGFIATGNPGAISVHWRSGEKSLFDDIFFEPDQEGTRIAPAMPLGPKLALWVEDGGGHFLNFWSLNVTAENALQITDTEIPGVVYLASLEHHLETELLLRNVRGWDFVALQTEADQNSDRVSHRGIRAENVRDVRFVNLFMYRGSKLREHATAAVELDAFSRNVQFEGLHVFSLGSRPYTHGFLFQPEGGYIAIREASRLTIRE